MSKFSDFLENAAGGANGLVNSVIGNFLAGFTNRANRKFQAKENAKEREFNALQAQIARDWQEEQYIKYSSPAAMARQYEDAGFNPMLAAGMTGHTFSGATASSTSSSSPSSVFQPTDIDIVGGILEVLGFKDELKNNESQRNVDASEVEKNKSEAAYYESLKIGKDIENEFSPEIFRQNIQQGKLNLTNSVIGINLALEDLKQKPLEYAQRISNLTNDVVNRNYTLAATGKTLEETATERLKQAGLVIDNRNKDLMTTSIILEQCLTAADITLKNAQTNKVNNDSESVRLDNLKKSYEINLKKRFGYTSNDFLDQFGINYVMHWVINAYDAARTSLETDYQSVYEVPK